METNTCMNCGTVNLSNSKYCKSCGKSLPKMEVSTLTESKNIHATERESSAFDSIMEIIYWILIFFSPSLVFALASITVYFNNPKNSLLSIIFLILGATIGIILAERIRRKYGTANYMGRILGNSEFIEDDSKETKPS